MGTKVVFVDCTDLSAQDVPRIINASFENFLYVVPEDAKNLLHTVTPVVLKHVRGFVGDRKITDDVYQCEREIQGKLAFSKLCRADQR